MTHFKDDKLLCNAKGLHSAVLEAFNEMEDEGVDGFEYKIGQYNGRKIKLVVDTEKIGMSETITMEGPFLYKAIVDLKDNMADETSEPENG